MKRITSLRVPTLVFGAGITAVLAFGATSAVAAPRMEAANPFFCGYYDSLDGCERCCGNYQAWWDEYMECWCGPDRKL